MQVYYIEIPDALNERFIATRFYTECQTKSEAVRRLMSDQVTRESGPDGSESDGVE